MTDFTSWLSQLEQAGRNTLGSIVGYLPNLAGVMLLLLFGWLIARWARTGFRKLGEIVNRLLARVIGDTSYGHFQLSSRAIQIIGNAVFWLVILVFLTAAAKVARLDTFSDWLDRILAYLPVLLAGGLIIAFGYLASLFVRDVASAALESGGFRHSLLLGRLVQGAVFLTAVVIGVDQIGLDVSFLITIIAIVLASVLGGLALAFGFGSRDFVANVIAAHNMQQQYRPGQNVKFGKISGEILELTPTSVVLATKDGRTTVPAREFHTSSTVLLTPEDDRD